MGLGGAFCYKSATDKLLGAHPAMININKLFEEMDRLRGDPIFPNGREQPPMQERDFDFDSPSFENWPLTSGPGATKADR